MHQFIRLSFFLAIGFFMAAAATGQEKLQIKNRQFAFHYGASVLNVPAEADVKIWFPIAISNQNQTVSLRSINSPGSLQINTDPKYGNKIGFVSAKATNEEMGFAVKYAVDRKEAGIIGPKKLNTEEHQTFIAPNTLVPITGKPIELLKGKTVSKQPLAAGQQIYDIVEQHMRYDKSVPGYGFGDSVWACDSKTGNCTDFHSLFISLARSRQLPARFEIGFPLPTDKSSGKIGGYHCWAWFHAQGKGWVPVDISEADKHPEMSKYFFGNLTPDRIGFTTGRDIKLIPKSNEKPLNYFVYPHVEVNGKTWPKEKIKLNFSFENTTEAKSKQ